MSLITRMSLKNRLIVGLLTLVIAVFGIVATTSLNQETMPSVDLPSTSVQATVPGASPEVVEETVTKPVETALEGIGELESVTTSTSSGMMTAEVTWPFGKDSEKMTDSIRSAVDGAKANLPTTPRSRFCPIRWTTSRCRCSPSPVGEPKTLGDR